MGQRTILVSLLLLFNYLLVAETETANQDFIALKALMDSWKDVPLSWSGSDPCDDGWDGIKCTNSHVTSIVLPSMGLTGHLSGDIGLLSELDTLDLSYNKGLTGSLPQEIGNLKLSNLFLVGCSFIGPIPDNIGSLQQLVFLSLNSNRFSGKIPASIGNLSKLTWLDLTDNQLEGPIPVSSGGAPGLDKLLNAKHFHLGMNKLSGTIPPQLFSSEMTLIHVLLDRNQLTGSIPSTLGLVQSLEVVRFDSNSLTGPVPLNINNLTKVSELYLSNNKLMGPLPNLSGIKSLGYLDMSNNSFDPSEFPPWLTTLGSLTTLKMEGTQLTGQIPVSLFSLTNLQTVVLKHNDLNGTLDIGTGYGMKLHRIELQDNKIDSLKQHDEVSSIKIILVNNPICQETGTTESYCFDLPFNITYAAPPNICLPVTCSSDQILSPKCKCAYPFMGILTFRTLSFLDWEKDAGLEKSLMDEFKEDHLPVDSVSLSNLTMNQFQYLELSLQVFPSGQDYFNRTEISSISCLLSNLTKHPFYFIAYTYGHYEDPMESSKSSHIAFITGAAVGGSVVLVLLLLAGIYAFHQKKRAEKAIAKSNPFGRWVSKDSECMTPQLKGIKQFSFVEIQKYTRNFSQDNDIGSGGYGKVYRGTLPDRQLVAIKRAQKDSKQGRIEFKAELELLSRVHHKNLVSLVGFCFERGEQMLVYEYVPNGTLHDTITGKSGIRLDWIRRLKVALGAARGLAYLHEHANPPIIHRDIKPNNILLDEHLNAKVADFGLSKPMIDCEKDHVTTQVKGTLGYLDPEYYTSQQLTEKSDVYSFGVVMLELITARKPIERGKYIVKVVRNSIDRTKDLYGLHEFLDPVIINLGSTLKGMEKFIDLSLMCLEDSSADRPTMNEVVKELENLLHSAGFNATAESSTAASTSSSYDEITTGSSQHLYSNESFDSSVVPLQQKIKAK
ncbi:putative leucine-rich repeat receptor-like protein kinase [Senna tora]|uniref:non-specific serine/threonine protein kinase n=1 Tax=Senna tora TaxID=362788 RepID=A0A834XF60_9FABA|nr:putative leucine-rich repeat receptor-like protein kinase [Senna tora]